MADNIAEQPENVESGPKLELEVNELEIISARPEAVVEPEIRQRLTPRTIDVEKATKAHNKESKEFDCKTIVMLVLWFLIVILSSCSNRYVLKSIKLDVHIAGWSQILISILINVICIETKVIKFLSYENNTINRDASFYGNMVAMGFVRCSSVYLLYIATSYGNQSLIDYVKLGGPVITFVINFLLFHKREKKLSYCSLLIVQVGLTIGAVTEIMNNNWMVFTLALGTTLADCLQGIHTKYLLETTYYDYNNIEIMTYSSCYSFLFNLLVYFFFLLDNAESKTSYIYQWNHLFYYLINGIMYHLLSLFNYFMMEKFSAQMYSIFRTMQRMLLILWGIFFFQESISMYTGIGIAIITIGVFIYIYATKYSLANFVFYIRGICRKTNA